MKLSVAMIVKNEEKNLDRTLTALMKLKGKLDFEIVIVDTGSTDNTIAIAKKYTDRVYFHEWNNDFAAMRNISIKYCTGDWLLILDADEVLDNHDELVKFFESDYKKFNCAVIKFINYVDKKNGTYVLSGMCRLFKNLSEFCYKGKVHEQPVLIKPLGNTKIAIKHYGYVNTDYELMNYKYKRNIELLLKDLENGAEQTYTYYQLAQSYNMANQRERAFFAIRKSYSIAEKNDLFKNRIYIPHLYAKKLFEMLDFEKSIEIAKKSLDYTEAKLDFYYIIAICLQEMNRINEAEEYFEKYLLLHKKQTENGYIQDLVLSEFSFALKDEILVQYVICLYQGKKYELAYKYYLEICDDNKRLSLEQVYLSTLTKLQKYDEFKMYFKNHNVNDAEIQIISDIIERTQIESDVDDIKVINNYRGIDDKIDLLINVIYENEINIDVERLNINKFYKWKWKILSNTDKKNMEFIDKIKVLNNSELINYLTNMIQDYSWIKILDDFCNKNFFTDDIIDLNFIINVEQLLLFSNKISEDKYKYLVKRAFVNITKFINRVFNLKYLNSNNYNTILSNYFIMWLRYEEMIKIYSEDRVEYIKGLKNLVDEMPEFMLLIQFFIKNINSDSISKDMIKEKGRLINISENYISEGKYEKALEILNEINTIFIYDSDIINMIGITQFYLKDNTSALINLAFSCKINPDKFDLVYNLAFVLDSVGKKEEAKEYYKKALDLSTDEEIKNKIRELIK